MPAVKRCTAGRDGTLDNILLNDSHNGYGTVQVQAGENIGFRSIDGIGGVTLRLETGAALTNELKIGKVDQVKAYDIRCSNGDAAITIQPHTTTQGQVFIEKVSTTSCNFAVKLEKGFASKKREREGRLIPGSFDSGSSIKGIHAYYGLECQLKFKNVKRLTPAEQAKIEQALSEDQISFRGPSAAAVSNMAGTPEGLASGEPGYYDIQLENVTIEGFPEGAKKVLHEQDQYPYSLEKKVPEFDAPYGRFVKGGAKKKKQKQQKSKQKTTEDKSLDESDFYKETPNSGIVKNLVTDYKVNATDTEDDSPKLQKAINALSKKEGGKIVIPAGVYYLLGIQLKSNVHLEIAEGATLFPAVSEGKNVEMFTAGKEVATIRNFSVRGLGKGFTVDLRQTDNARVRVFQLLNVENFLLDNFTVQDKQTRFSSITFNTTRYNGEFHGVKNGIVKNVKVFDTHYGYGLSQIKSGIHVLFKNLYGQGGVTLRLETGSDGKSDNELDGLMGDMYARNISCEDGNASVMISPHSRKIGKADVRGVYAKNCGFAVRIGKGYIAGKHKNMEGLNPGTFEPSVVTDVTAVYGTSAQLKPKHFRYMPCALRDQAKKIPNTTNEKDLYLGPSINAVINTAEGEGVGYYKVQVSNVKMEGFGEGLKAVMTEKDAVVKCKD